MRYFIMMQVAFLATQFYGVSYYTSFSSTTVFLQLQARALFSIIGFVIMVVAVQLIPIVFYLLIEMTFAFWASIMGFIFFRDTLTMFEICAMICGFGGIAMVLLFSSKTEGEGVDEN